jgi:hypothetical protein
MGLHPGAATVSKTLPYCDAMRRLVESGKLFRASDLRTAAVAGGCSKRRAGAVAWGFLSQEKRAGLIETVDRTCLPRRRAI